MYLKMEDVIEAEQEAHRFLKRVAAYKAKFTNMEVDRWQSPERAAMKRACLDLRQALVKLRRRRGR